MTTDTDVLFPASRVSEKGKHLVASLGDRVACGLSAGSGASLNPKTWVNEDSVCAHRLPDGSLLAAVADSHWGGAAGEVVVQACRSAFEKTRGATTLDRLHLALRGIDARLHLERQPGDGSETTALLVHLAGRALTWVSVGDSLLFLLSPRACSLRNPPSGQFPLPFLGAMPMARLPGHLRPDAGTLTLKPGEVVLLASDGLEVSTSALEPSDVVQILCAQEPLQARVERLLARADEPARGGGADNLGVVAIEVT